MHSHPRVLRDFLGDSVKGCACPLTPTNNMKIVKEGENQLVCLQESLG